MPNKPWKNTERRVAALFGTKRVPLSGMNSRHGTHSDTLHPTLYIEVKHGSACPATWPKIEKLFRSVEQKALLEKKVPVLVLHRKGAHGGVSEDDSYVRLDLGQGAVEPIVCVPLRTTKDLHERGLL